MSLWLMGVMAAQVILLACAMFDLMRDGRNQR
jgi:hypothetical protein